MTPCRLLVVRVYGDNTDCSNAFGAVAVDPDPECGDGEAFFLALVPESVDVFALRDNCGGTRVAAVGGWDGKSFGDATFESGESICVIAPGVLAGYGDLSFATGPVIEAPGWRWATDEEAELAALDDPDAVAVLELIGGPRLVGVEVRDDDVNPAVELTVGIGGVTVIVGVQASNRGTADTLGSDAGLIDVWADEPEWIAPGSWADGMAPADVLAIVRQIALRARAADRADRGW